MGWGSDMDRPCIAIQLFTLREPAKEDLAGTLRRVREAGWRYVQWSGMPDLPAEEIRMHLDAAGLVCVAGHDGMERFEEDFEARCAFWRVLGAGDVAPGGMMEDCCETRERWLQGARRLDVLGARLKRHGMRLSYHNHDVEFERFEGEELTKLDLLYVNTEPEHLYAELDLAWVQVAGESPAGYLRKYAGRCPVIHVKDLSPDKDEEGRPKFEALGCGTLEWPPVFEAARSAGVEWYVYEQDTCDGDLFEAIRISYAFLEKQVLMV